MALTKAQQAAKLAAAADTAQPTGERDLQAEAEAGDAQANAWEADYLARWRAEHPDEAPPGPASYAYVGGLAAVVVVLGGTAYDFRAHEPVHLPHPEPGLDGHPDFRRVDAPEGSGA